MSGDRSRWLVIALAVSVLLNLFLVGVIIGQLSFPALPRDTPGAVNAFVVRARVRNLPVIERVHFAFTMRQHAGELRRARQALRDARHSAETAIIAPNYNEGVVKARFAEVRRASAAQQQVLHDALAQALGVLSPQSRAAIIGEQNQHWKFMPRPCVWDRCPLEWWFLPGTSVADYVRAAWRSIINMNNALRITAVGIIAIVGFAANASARR